MKGPVLTTGFDLVTRTILCDPFLSIQGSRRRMSSILAAAQGACPDHCYVWIRADHSGAGSADVPGRLGCRPTSIDCLWQSASGGPRRHHSEDAVIAAQMWHWVDVPSALDQLHRILCPANYTVEFRDETVLWACTCRGNGFIPPMVLPERLYSESKGPRLDERFDLVDTFGARHLQVMTLMTVGLAGTFSHSDVGGSRCGEVPEERTRTTAHRLGVGTGTSYVTNPRFLAIRR